MLKIVTWKGSPERFKKRKSKSSLWLRPELYTHPDDYLALAAGIVVIAKTNLCIVMTLDEVFFSALRASVRRNPCEAALYVYPNSSREVKKYIIDSDGRLDAWPIGIFETFGRCLNILL